MRFGSYGAKSSDIMMPSNQNQGAKMASQTKGIRTSLDALKNGNAKVDPRNDGSINSDSGIDGPKKMNVTLDAVAKSLSNEKNQQFSSNSISASNRN